MSNESRKHRAGQWLAVACTVCAAFAAQAAEPASATTGLMTFSNVQIVSNPAEARQARTGQAPAPQGLRAFIDPETRKLRQPTAEEAATLAAGEHNRLGRGKVKPGPAAPSTLIYPAQGGVGMEIDASQLSFLVARKDTDGKLIEECLPNAEEARTFLQTQSTVKNMSAVKGSLQ